MNQSSEVVCDWKIRVRRVLAAVGLLVIFGCGDVASCLGEGEGGGQVVLPGIYLGTTTQAFSDPLQARGETFSIPVTVRLTTGEQTSFSSVVTPKAIPGVTFTPASQTVNVGSTPETVTFNATIADTAALGDFELRFTRTGSAADSLRTTNTALTVANLAQATITPTSRTINAGETRTFEVAVLPRGLSEGPIQLQTNLNATDVTVTPANFTVNLVRGSSTPILETISVFAHANVASKSAPLRIRQDSQTLASADVNFIAGGGSDFTFTASPTTVSGAIYVLTQEVTFTLTSLGGYSGTLLITPEAGGPVGEEPVTGEFQLTLAAGETKTFKRKFMRFPGAETNEFFYVARDTVTNDSKQVTITITP